jgi:N6-L-threonylcarbamoyladenine synthase
MYLGIDTSCYTTSLAIVDDTGTLIFERRKLLRVKPGEKGLRQSEAVFQHIQQLPQLLDEFCPGEPFTAVAASTTPRPSPGSYLPVFNVGAGFGKTIAGLLGVPFFATSHQEGHLRAGLYRQTPSQTPFLAWHISGGTTELLLVTPQADAYGIEKIGGSNDLHIGQLVDRIGVALGAPFPAGPFLEQLALSAPLSDQSLPVSVRGLEISFSGPATAALRLIRQGVSGPEVAQRVFTGINRSLWRVTRRAAELYPVKQVLLVGGVAANRLLREYMQQSGTAQGLAVSFGPPELSSDNAAGVALLAYDRSKIGTRNLKA